MSIKKIFSDWQVHLLCLGLVIIAELISPISFKFGTDRTWFTLLPMLYVLVIGLVLGATGVIKNKHMEIAVPYIGISVMWLVAKMGASIGPNLHLVIEAGPTLILQELGNLCTVLFALPIAIFVFKMGRQAIGASFSTSREGSIAIVGDLYGLASPEGQGVMGAYITGTLFGTIFNSILVSILIALNIFNPLALAMAAGTGSASMMAACLGPLIESYPHLKSEMEAMATASQVLTNVDGMYISLFVAIPFTNWLYKVFKGPERHAAHVAKKAASVR